MLNTLSSLSTKLNSPSASSGSANSQSQKLLSDLERQSPAAGSATASLIDFVNRKTPLNEGGSKMNSKASGNQLGDLAGLNMSGGEVGGGSSANNLINNLLQQSQQAGNQQQNLNQQLNLIQQHYQQQQQQQQQQQLQHQLNNLSSQVDSIEANKGYTFEEQFKQLYELDDDPKRKEFLDDLFQFMADRNQPVNRIPIMAKHVLDLYELYNLVVARGGLVEVINKKIWREITKGLNLPNSITSAAFTLRTQYMKYLYPYECAKNNFSHQDELQQAIDGNRREGRRAGGGNGSLLSASGQTPSGANNPYANYLGALGEPLAQQLTAGQNQSHYSNSPSPTGLAGNQHLFSAAGHNLLSQAVQSVVQQQQQQQQQQQPAHRQQQAQNMLLADLQRPHSSNSSNGSPSYNNRLYQDSIESDREDEESIDLAHCSKRSSPIEQDNHLQHLDSHHQNNHTNTQNNNHHSNHHNGTNNHQADQQHQLAAAAAAAALRQQFGVNLSVNQNFLSQLTSLGAANGKHNLSSLGIPTPSSAPISNSTNTSTNANATNPSSGATINQPGTGHSNNNGTINSDVLKQQQEQFLAALMAVANQQQQQTPQLATQHQQPPATNPDQQAAARAALSMMASNAMLIPASNAPDAMAMATAAQAIGVKGAFIILLL